MKSTIKALVATLAASTALTGAALAQRDYGGAASQQTRQPQPTNQQKEEKESKPSKGQAVVTVGNKKIKLSPGFSGPYQEVIKAVEANDYATAATKAAAAHAAAANADEHFLASQADLKIAFAKKDEAAIGAAVDAMLATGAMPAEQQSVAYLTQGKVRFNQRKYADAITSLQKTLQLDPANAEAKDLLAKAQSQTATPADAVAALEKDIAAQSANGAKAPEELYKQALKRAYNAKLPGTVDLSRRWVAAYPTEANWKDAIGIYRNLSNVDEAGTLDLLRLARATKALKSEADYDRYAYALITKGYPGEANAVLEEGIKAGVVDPNKTPFKEMIPQAKTKSAGEAATLSAAASKAIAGGTAKATLATGDLLYGYGEFAKAAEVYRAALKRPGVDANLANLHLGMALARAGDKAGATAALNAVTGTRAEIAKYWLTYVSTLS